MNEEIKQDNFNLDNIDQDDSDNQENTNPEERNVLAVFNDQVKKDFKDLKMDLDFDLYSKVKDCVTFTDLESNKESLQNVMELVKLVRKKAYAKRIQQDYTPPKGKAINPDPIKEAFKPPTVY